MVKSLPSAAIRLSAPAAHKLLRAHRKSLFIMPGKTAQFYVPVHLLWQLAMQQAAYFVRIMFWTTGQ